MSAVATCSKHAFLARTGSGRALHGLATRFAEAYAWGLEEVVERRTKTCKVFAFGDETFWTIVGQSPIHVPRDYAAWKAGEQQYADWLDIDTRPVAVRDGFSPTRVWYDATARRRQVVLDFQSLDGATASMRLATIGGHAPRVGRVSLLRNGLRYHNIALQTDIDVIFERTKVRWLLRFKGEHAPRNWAWEAAGAEQLVNWRHEGWDNADNADPVRKREVWDLNRQRRTRLTISEPIPVDGGVRVEGSWNGELIEREAVTRRKMLSRRVIWPVVVDPTVADPVIDNADDGEESTYLGTWDASPTSYGSRVMAGATSTRNCGLRWRNIAIDAGASHSSASIDLSLHKGGSAGVTCTLRGDKVTNAALWSSSSRPSQVSTTTATKAVDLTVANGPVNVEMLTIAQEIFGQGGWNSGQAARFSFDTASGTGSTQSHIDDLNALGVEAVLNVVWSAGGRASKNTKPWPLGMAIGMGIGMGDGA